MLDDPTPAAKPAVEDASEPVPPAPKPEPDEERYAKLDDGDTSEKLPEWAKNAIPSDMRFRPPPGVVMHFLRFRKELTKQGTRAKGDRVVIVWELSLQEERVARSRTFGDSTRTYEELSKMMLRAVDGTYIDQSHPDLVDRTWDEIGPRYRNTMNLWYLRTHNLSEDDRLRFFVYDVTSRSYASAPVASG